MNELSQRFLRAITFLKENGYAKNDTDIANTIGIHVSFLNMGKRGVRAPTWDTLLRMCEHYPLNIWWFRTGNGSMIREDRETGLLKKIEELENKIAELEK